MKRAGLILLALTIAGSALANKYVNIDSDGAVQGVSSFYGKHAKVNHTKNQYTDAEWDAFGITEEAPYIVKDGAVWRDMNQAEKDALDAQLQQDALDKAKTDVNIDAIIKALADLLNKPVADIEEAFKTGVDPKKAKKAKA